MTSHAADGPGGPAPGRDPLLRPDWRYVEKTTLEDYARADWELMNGQRAVYGREEIPRQMLRILTVSRDDPTFGYMVNNYQHSLQTATMMMRDGHDEETVVMALLHDVGFTLCPDRHPEFAADLLAPYLGEQNEWVLRYHGIFQQHHIHEYDGLDPRARERFRGHPHFAAAAEFVERYDILAIDPDRETAPIEVFEPMVYRVLGG